MDDGEEEEEEEREPARLSQQFKGELKSASIKITRLQLLVWLNQRQFWAVGQWNLLFTILMWFAFVVSMVLRTEVHSAYSVHEALVHHVHHLAAHPSLSGVAMKLPEDLTVPCRCACGAMKKPDFPSSPCDEGAEVLDFMGYLPSAMKVDMMREACEDMPEPLMEFSSLLEPGVSNMTCGQWLSMYGSPAEGELSACSADSFEDYLRPFISLPENVNDTLSHHLVHQGDFKAPQWRCPRTCNVCKETISDGEPALMWGQINTEEDVMTWIEHGMLPDVFGGGINGPFAHQAGMMQQRNLIIGGLRARQFRAETPFSCAVPEDLAVEYKPQCRSRKPAAGYPAANVSSDLTAAYTPATASDASAPAGAFDVHFDVERPASDAFQLATSLRRSGWLTGAGSLLLQGLVLNAEAKFYGLLEISFSFRYDGSVDKQVSVRILQALDGKIKWLDHIPEIVTAVLILALLRQELQQVIVLCWRGESKLYWSSPWNLLDWFSIFLGVFCLLFYYFLTQWIGAITSKVIELPRSPLPSSVSLDAYHGQWADVLDTANHVINMKEWYLFTMFIYSSQIAVRFLKGFLTQQKLAMIQHSMASASWDVFHFTIIFTILFANFVVGGRVLFGEELDEWSTYPKSAASTAEMLLGTFNFDQMYELAPISATIWFWLFLLTMVFLFLSVLTAIIVDHFRAFRHIVGHTDHIFYDVYQGIRELLWRCEWRWENLKDQEWGTVISDPYDGLQDGLIGITKIPEDMQVMAHDSSLGYRLSLLMEENKSLEGSAADELRNDDPRVKVVSSLELRTEGEIDPMTVEHVMEECNNNVRRHALLEMEAQPSEIQQVRVFRKLLNKHRETLEFQCGQIEAGIEEEQVGLNENMQRFEESVTHALRGLEELRLTKVDSLALPPPKLPFVGTSLRDTYTKKLGKHPQRMGTDKVPGRGGLRITAAASSEQAGFALGDYPQTGDPLAAQSAMAIAYSNANDTGIGGGPDAAVVGDQPELPALADGTDIDLPE